MYCKRVARNDVLGLGPAVLGAENLASTQWFGQLGGFYVALLALLTLKMWDHVETVRIYNQKKIFLSVISFDKGECRHSWFHSSEHF